LRNRKESNKESNKGSNKESNKGIERGSLQSSRELLLQTIQVRFGQIPEELRVSINACTSTENLSNFHRQALLAKSIDELPRQLT